MPIKKNDPELKKVPELYVQDGNIEAHIIADMLRIESITAELKEFKEVTRDRLNKLESWIVAIVGITVTTLIATVGGLVFRVLS